MILFLSSCKTNRFSNSTDVSAMYLTVLPYTVSPFSINEIDIHFEDENTCSQLRIHDKYIELVKNRLLQLKPTTYTNIPKEYRKYAKVWIGVQLANEKKRFSVGILKDGIIKIGSHFFEKDDELLSIIFKQKIHPRILETIPRDSIWGKFLIH